MMKENQPPSWLKGFNAASKRVLDALTEEERKAAVATKASMLLTCERSEKLRTYLYTALKVHAKQFGMQSLEEVEKEDKNAALLRALCQYSHAWDRGKQKEVMCDFWRDPSNLTPLAKAHRDLTWMIMSAKLKSGFVV
jgi:hypothetical protein